MTSIDPGRTRVIAAVMCAVAASLAVMVLVHLVGILEGDPPFNATHAGIAEAIIGLVLLAGAATLLSAQQQARALAVASIAFAIVGFLVGLSFTVRGAGVFDVAYHAIGLPILLLTLVMLVRLTVRDREPRS